MNSIGMIVTWKRCLIITCFVLMTVEMIESKRHRHNRKIPRSIRRKQKPQLIHSHKLTEDEQTLVITVSNQIRKNVDPQPARMLRLKYDPQLAEYSANQANKCAYEHSQPEAWDGTPFAQPGENLYYITDLRLDIATSLTRAICKWASESNYYDYTSTTCDRGKECGHYTELVWADNDVVACAVSDCRNVMVGRARKRSARIVWCNYMPGGNYYGEKPYVSGTVSCSQCRQTEDCVCADDESKQVEKLFCESGTATTTTSKATTTISPIPTTAGNDVLPYTSKGMASRKGKTALNPRSNTTHISGKDTATTSSKNTTSTELDASKPSTGAPSIDTTTTTISPRKDESPYTSKGMSARKGQTPLKTGGRGTTLGKYTAITSNKNTTSTDLDASKPSKEATDKISKTVTPSIDTTTATVETSKDGSVLSSQDVVAPTKVSSIKLTITPSKNTTTAPNKNTSSTNIKSNVDERGGNKTVKSINNTTVPTVIEENRGNKTRVIVNGVTLRKATSVVKSNSRRGGARKECLFCSFGSLFSQPCYKKCHQKMPKFDHYKSAKLCFNIL